MYRLYYYDTGMGVATYSFRRQIFRRKSMEYVDFN
jgi:hypothetical protein